MKLARTIAALIITASVSLGIAGCAPSPTPSTVSANTVFVDVRTPAEYASGHLEGAISLDVEASTFDSLAAQLPADGTYLVYCRSGNRAAAAITRLQQLGFTNLTNGGGLDSAAASTGLKVVQ
ncbi:rhodanese-like domain-containing protein [soil metagenome]